MAKTVLVTGVAGFIGSHVAEHCLKLGYSVVGADDLSGGFPENVPAGVDFRRGSVVDPAFVKSLFSGARVDFVYHLAAYAAEGLSHHVRRFNYGNNLVGTVNLVNESVLGGVSCFVFTSSIAVYGPNQTPMTEDLVPRPENPYGIAKYAAELDLEAARRIFGLPFVVFRPHNVYGERQNLGDRYRNVVGIFMNQVMNGERMTIFGDGEQTRAFSHVDDVAPLIARAPLVPEARNQVFNVGADRPYTVKATAEAVARAFGVRPEIEHFPARPEVVHAFASHEKARRVFGPAEPVALEAGLERMARWARASGPRRPVTFDAIEVPVNLPPSWRPAGG